MAVDARVALVAFSGRTRPSREKTKARLAVAKTSMKPSTHRWTTHHLQYSMTDRWVRAP